MSRLTLACVTALLVSVSATVAFGAVKGAPIMGKPSRIARPAFRGFYDGHKDTYLNTDVSSKAEAKAMHVNF